MASYSAAYPLKLVNSMASGLKNAKHGYIGQIRLSTKTRSLQEVGLEGSDPMPTISTEPVYPDRPGLKVLNG